LGRTVDGDRTLRAVRRGGRSCGRDEAEQRQRYGQGRVRRFICTTVIRSLFVVGDFDGIGGRMRLAGQDQAFVEIGRSFARR
jgi:hypothetical protein